ncbi:uncharacterized protein LOC106138243 [Amyelois transitella]|uniref:uncharacterized protein LOC106138243 n=1 Tax=Amyelois transitella TaxID=680683 RepID=UPI00067E295F|nr:uncharacterized protein LOC106138243 [Amyelois transitella]
MDMKFLLILTLITAASAQKCRGTFFNNKYYNMEVLKEGLNRVKQMIYSSKENSVYFIYDQGGILYNGGAGYYNLNNHQAGFFMGIRNATSLAVDNNKNRIYIGCAEGLYAVTDGNLPERFPISEPILSLYYKDDLYFTNIRRKVYKFDLDGVKLVPEMRYDFADNIIVDDDNNLFFLKDKKVNRVKLDTGAPAFEVTEFPVNLMTMDVDGKLYVATNDGIYLYNRYKYALDKISNLKNVKALSFDKKWDPIYVVFDLLVRLKNPVECYEDNDAFFK